MSLPYSVIKLKFLLSKGLLQQCKQYMFSQSFKIEIHPLIKKKAVHEGFFFLDCII